MAVSRPKQTLSKSSFILSSCSRLSFFSALENQGRVSPFQTEAKVLLRYRPTITLNGPIYGFETLLNRFKAFFGHEAIHVFIQLFLHTEHGESWCAKETLLK